MVVRMFVSVELPDEPGALGDMARSLGDHDVNIDRFAVEQGKVRFLTGDAQAAMRILGEAGFEPHLVPALEVRLDNQPGQLARLASMLAAQGVRIISTFGVGQGDQGILYVRCDDARRALPVVETFQTTADIRIAA